MSCRTGSRNSDSISASGQHVISEEAVDCFATLDSEIINGLHLTHSTSHPQRLLSPAIDVHLATRQECARMQH